MSIRPWLALALPVIALAQDGGVSITKPGWSGLQIRFQAKVEPSASGSNPLPGSVSPTASGAHRLITDSANNRSFGYDLDAELLAGGQSLRLTLRPMASGSGSLDALRSNVIPPPKFPIIPPMRAGDTAAIDLLVNPATGQKVVEYLTVERTALDPARLAKEPPRDFSLDDVELLLDRPRVWVDGAFLEATANFSGGIRAHTLWLFIPGEGTFVISLAPTPGRKFEKAGMLQSNTIVFRSGSSEYRVECASPIAPGSGIYNVYLHFDPRLPNGRDTKFSIGGADKGRWLSFGK